MAQKRLVEEENLESVGLDVEDELGLLGWMNPRRKRALRELALIGAYLESIEGDPLSQAIWSDNPRTVCVCRVAPRRQPRRAMPTLLPPRALAPLQFLTKHRCVKSSIATKPLMGTVENLAWQRPSLRPL